MEFLFVFIFLAGIFAGFGKTTGLSILGILNVVFLSLLSPAKEAVGILLPILITGDIVAVTYYRRSIVWNYLIKLLPRVLMGLGAGYFVLLNERSATVDV